MIQYLINVQAKNIKFSEVEDIAAVSWTMSKLFGYIPCCDRQGAKMAKFNKNFKIVTQFSSPYQQPLSH